MTNLGLVVQILLFAILPGMIGGTFNAWLVHAGFVFPSTVSNDGGRRLWDPGFLANIALGAFAGLVTFCLMPDDSLSRKKLFGICALAGVAGGNVISSWLQRYNLIETRERELFFKDQLKAVLKTKPSRKKMIGETGVPSSRELQQQESTKQ